MTKVLQDLAAKIATRSAPEADHTVLSLHRALDALPKNGVGSFERLLLLALTAFGSFMAARFFLG